MGSGVYLLAGTRKEILNRSTVVMFRAAKFSDRAKSQPTAAKGCRAMPMSGSMYSTRPSGQLQLLSDGGGAPFVVVPRDSEANCSHSCAAATCSSEDASSQILPAAGEVVQAASIALG